VSGDSVPYVLEEPIVREHRAQTFRLRALHHISGDRGELEALCADGDQRGTTTRRPFAESGEQHREVPFDSVRLTGAPPSKFSKPYPLPKRPWGTEADEAFYSLTGAADKDGKVHDWDGEKLATDASWPIARRLGAPDVSDEVVLRYARHPDQGIREIAARAIARKAGDHLILELLSNKDPRARQAGTMAIISRTEPLAKGEPRQAEFLTDEMTALLLAMINDPEESWWAVEGALNCVGMARADLLAPHLDRLCQWLEHEDWWLRRAALTAADKLIADERFYQKLLPIIGKVAASNRNANLSWALWGLGNRLESAPPAVQKLAAETFAQAYGEFPKKLTVPGGVDMGRAESFLVENLATMLASQPGGLELLLELAAERYPGQPLPHKDLFFRKKSSEFTPEVKKAVNAVIRDQLIPEYVADNIASLMAEIRPEPMVADPKNQAKVEGLVELYHKMGVEDHNWRGFGPAWNEMRWDYFSFDPPETLPWKPGQTRYRKVTYPSGMENWFAKDFDAKKAGWKNGLQPFGQENDKLRTEPKPYFDQLHGRAADQLRPCALTYCRCCEPMQTFWEKEVLLIHGTVELPPLKENHRYRLVVGGLSHMNNGDGVRVYVNGKQVLERQREFKKREGGHPIVFYIDKERLDEFKTGKVTIAATGFLKIHLRSKNKGNFMGIWFEEMKMPPLDEPMFLKAATAKRMLTSAWQALQDPSHTIEDPEEGKFKWDGKFVANPALLGTWTTIAMAPDIEAFDPANPVSGRPPFEEITFMNGAQTNNKTMFWSGDTLLNLARKEALKMTIKNDHLFIEAGGFSHKNRTDWRSPWIVMKKQ
jgi:hypothetical protein